MAQHRLAVVPVKVSAWDAALRCERLRVVAWRAACSCGWRGPGRANVREARETGAAHRREIAEGAAQDGERP